MNVSYNLESDSRRCSFCNREYPRSKYCKHCIVEARSGFHGYVNMPTKFLVGEAGRERVDITPMKKTKNRGFFVDFDFSGELL